MKKLNLKNVILAAAFGNTFHAKFVMKTEEQMYLIKKHTNKTEKEVNAFLSGNVLSIEELYLFSKAFGKFPDKRQIEIISKARVYITHKSVLEFSYANLKEF